MKSGTRFVLLCSVAIIFPTLVVLMAFGAPHGYEEVGNFGSLLAALLSFVSVLLLLNSLDAQRRALLAQEKANEQSRSGALITAQLQALSTLIADDRSILNGMLSKDFPKQADAAEKKKNIFRSVHKRHRKNRAQLNELLQKNFNLGDSENIEEQETI